MGDQDLGRKADAFRGMHRGDLLLLPNAWDALSARVFEDAGARAVATTSAAVSWSLGRPDGERIPWSDFLAAIERIAQAVRVPVTADIESGFAASTAGLVANVRDVVRAGAVGINLEDSDIESQALVTMAQACEAVAAAREAGRLEGVPLVVNARVDAYLRAGGSRDAFEETLERGRAYLQAGADCIYPIGLADLGEIRRLVAALGAPVNVIGRPGMPTIAELRAAGVARVSTATTPALYVAGALKSAMRTLEKTGSFDHFASDYAYPDMQALFAPRARND